MTEIYLVKLLLERGANVNIQNNYGSTALIRASKYGHLEVIKLLLEKGADPFDKNNKNKYPLDLCKNEECKKIISKYMWDIMYGNVKIKFNRLKTKKVNKDVWELIFLRDKQKSLCKNLSSPENKYILMGFASMLNIPVTEDMLSLIHI